MRKLFQKMNENYNWNLILNNVYLKLKINVFKKVMVDKQLMINE